jgi:hypothetical protein
MVAIGCGWGRAPLIISHSRMARPENRQDSEVRMSRSLPAYRSQEEKGLSYLQHKIDVEIGSCGCAPAVAIRGSREAAGQGLVEGEHVAKHHCAQCAYGLWPFCSPINHPKPYPAELGVPSLSVKTVHILSRLDCFKRRVVYSPSSHFARSRTLK